MITDVGYTKWDYRLRTGYDTQYKLDVLHEHIYEYCCGLRL